MKPHLSKSTAFRILFALLFAAQLHGQSLPGARSTDWTIAGLRDTTYPGNISVFIGDSTGTTDNSTAFSNFLAGLTLPAIVQFEAGTYLFNSAINLPSDVVIRGKGAGLTTLVFNLSGAKSDCFEIIGSELPQEDTLAASAFKDDYAITLNSAAAFSVGDYLRFIKDDAALVNDSWAERRTGQVSRIAAINGNTLTLESPLRMDFLTSENPRVRKVIPKKNVGLECFTLMRTDQVSTPAERNQASKIRFRYAANCWVKGIESVNCNYAHVEALYSANLLVSGCYFHDAFDFGDGGRAYGVMLHFATSESRVENTVFSTLRHAMIVQAGANGNVFAYNYSENALKTLFTFTIASEDLVCHGNYAYLNLFEANVVEWPKVDASHGSNGPFNTFFRNRGTTGNNFAVSFTSAGNNNDNQNFLGNEGGASFSGSNHYEFLNSWQGTTGNLETSLAYTGLPDFLTTAQYGAIGYGYFGISAKNPANLRFDSGIFIDEVCGQHVWTGTAWQGNFEPNNSSANFDLRIDSGQVCTLAASASAHRVTVKPGGKLDVPVAHTINLSDSIFLLADETGYAQFNGDAALPARWQLVISEPGWHHITAPLASVSLAQLEDEITIGYGAQANASAYTWDPDSAQYQAVANNTFNLGQHALNLFIDDLFVKPNKGINQDGNLPLRFTLKGTLNNGAVSNSTLGYGTAANVVGPDADGWNYVFNPYPCSIDLDVVFASPPTHYQIGAHVFNAATNAFEVRTLSSINNGNASHIAPGQSFYVKLDAGANINSGFFDFTNAVRSLAEPPQYKTAAPGLSFMLYNSQDSSRAHTYFMPHAALSYSPETDISSLFNRQMPGSMSLAILKQNGGEMRRLAVAAFTEAEEALIMPLSMYVESGGDYYLKIVANNTAHNYWLEDRDQGNFISLSSPVSIELDTGYTNNRFFVHLFKKEATSEGLIAAHSLTPTALIIRYEQSPIISKSAVRLVDITGKEMLPLTEFTAMGETRIALSRRLKRGVYIVQIREGNNWHAIKVVL
jgi:hypothetical protein